jgi:integrase/recombinase XerC
MTPFFLIQFLDFLEIEKRYSSHTIVAYKKDIEQFLDFSCIESVKDLADVNYQNIRSWLVEILEKGNSNRTAARKISSLRVYFKWLHKEGIITDNPVSKIKAPKQSKRLPSFFRESQLDSNGFQNMFDESFEGIRNKLIIEVLYQTGIRLSELIDLKIKNLADDKIKVLGKRNKERVIPISDHLNVLIKNYLKIVESKDLIGEYLFVLKNGKKIYPKLVYRLINFYLGNIADVDKCSPHVLRHTFATHMLNNGAGLETLKDLLGHANLSATQVYTHNTFSQLTNIYSQTHPRGTKNK